MILSLTNIDVIVMIFHIIFLGFYNSKVQNFGIVSEKVTTINNEKKNWDDLTDFNPNLSKIYTSFPGIILHDVL